MSDIQYSDDGQWWWDEQAQQWVPVAADPAGSADSAESAETTEYPGAEPAAEDAEAESPLATMSESEANSYFAQALDAGMSEVYEA